MNTVTNTTTSKGLKWGPFTLRIPFIHLRFRAGEFFQGMVISGATAFAAVPIAMGLGLTFEEGVALSFIAGTLIGAGPIFFGEPMAPGWVTPAVPIVIAAFAAKGQFNGVYDPAVFQFMAAMCIEFTLLLFIMGITGWGKKLIEIIPNGLKAGIILGAALAAFYQVFVTDLDKLMIQPISMGLAISLCVITTFSEPFKKLALNNKFFKVIGSLGLLPGFVLAALVAFLLNEVTFNIEWGFRIPDVVSLFNRTSPLAIGFPSIDMYLEAIPLVVIGYTLLFGDLITGTEVLNDAQSQRPDEPLDVNLDRSHLSVAMRNFLGLLVNPFFPTQGALWTGVHVVVAERWKKGPKEMPSIFDGLGSYYLMGIPFLYVTLPFITLMKPLMQMALTLTLILTGFACAYVAMAIPKKNSEMASALLIAVFITFFSAWIGLLIGILLSIFVVGTDKDKV
ncbi:MAG: hypothetical protein ISR29_00360 [SAR86 cluster bacterium]|jgi:hypothetical protein|uniref:Xanthine/uracil/vitamin C permease n=1 Tax=SAR86 cluster bacterium TaxID=2030880 RepID=A0A937LYP2_9GAMM|nr:hypothetical protein [SAR86 cluster bacterium]MDG1203058.1 hypothetical protein [SAR86 cluster bacterium]MDG1721827.1 hypothetical protein [SAR86 cluster bacterium]